MKRRRISLRLDSRLARRIKKVAQAEGRSWTKQAQWFLEVFSGILEESAFRPMPRKLPKNIGQDSHWSLFPSLSLYRRLKAFSESEQITLVELIRQLLWAEVEQWRRLRRPGVRKEAFKRKLQGSLTKGRCP